MVNPMLTKLYAEARTDDFRRAAARVSQRGETGAAPARATEAAGVAITIRPALPGDRPALARLADLDSGRLPTVRARAGYRAAQAGLAVGAHSRDLTTHPHPSHTIQRSST